MPHVIAFEVTCAVLNLTMNQRLRQYIEFMEPAKRELFLTIAESMSKSDYPIKPEHDAMTDAPETVNAFKMMRQLAAVYANTRFPTFHVLDKLYFDHYGEAINEHHMLVDMGQEVEFTMSFHHACYRPVMVSLLPTPPTPSADEEIRAYEAHVDQVNDRLLSLAKAIRQADLILPTIAETIA